MKDFYTVCEPICTNGIDYRNSKRKTVLETIRPICEAFEINDYDYYYNENGSEVLEVEGQKIGCDCNSIGCIVNELIGYIFVVSGCGCTRKYYDEFVEELKRYWR